MKLFVFLGLLITFVDFSNTSGCKPVTFGSGKDKGVACKCDNDYCDSLQVDWPENDDDIVRVTTSKSGDRFKIETLSSSDLKTDGKVDYQVEVNVGDKRQNIYGFGQGITESTGLNIFNTTGDLPDTLIKDLYGPNGLDYSWIRVPIGGCDVSPIGYTLDDLKKGDEDLELKRFSLQPLDLEVKIPFIKKIMDLRENKSLRLMATAWTPPIWMKDNNSLSKGQLKGNYTGPYYDAFARYLMKFLDEYEKRDIHFDSMSAINEPTLSHKDGIKINSCLFSPKQLVDFNEFNLIPLMKQRDNPPRLFFFDDQLPDVSEYTKEFLSRPEVVQYVKGFWRHSYFKTDEPYEQLANLTRQYPDSYEIGSNEYSIVERPKPGSWPSATKYAVDIMEVFMAGYSYYLDWAGVLDSRGGPSWVNNYINAPIIIDKSRSSYYKSPSYYVIGQFSRFLKPNSRYIANDVQRIKNGDSIEEPLTDNIDKDEKFLTVNSAQLEPDDNKKRIAVVILNRNDKKRIVKVKLTDCDAHKDPLALEMKADSIISLALNC